jgi:hypothetical protein
MENRKLSENLDIKNKQIFKYLRENGLIPSYETIDNDLGTNKYFNKFAQNNKIFLTKVHTYAFEAIYDIPHSLFFNKDIKEFSQIEPFIRNYRLTKGVLVTNDSPEALEQFLEYKYLYTYYNQRVYRYYVNIQDLYVSIIDLSTNKLKYKGFVNVSCSSILLIFQNLVTRNDIVIKVILTRLVTDIIPCSYLGHKKSSNEEVAWFGIMSKKELSDEEIKEFFEIDASRFSKIAEQVIEKIRIKCSPADDRDFEE